jgi:hypothetical protein
MPSQADIARAALSKLGTWTISSLSDSSKEARALVSAWDRVLGSELAVHPWTFATEQGELGALTETPVFDYDFQYQLPMGFLRLVQVGNRWAWDPPDKPNWRIQGRALLTDMAPPLELRWIGMPDSAAEFPWEFVDVLACRLADDLCELLTGSKDLKASVKQDYLMALRAARLTNAIMHAPRPPRDTSWITVRN